MMTTTERGREMMREVAIAKTMALHEAEIGHMTIDKVWNKLR